MDNQQREEREREIVELIRQTLGDWNEIHIHVCANTRSIGTSTRADIRLPRPVPRQATDKLSDLRELMADPQRGAWLIADITVPRTGDATFRYDWMSKPDWPALGGDFDETRYLDDLAAFPRTPDNIPDWYPSADSVAPTPEYADTDAERPPPPPPRRGDSPDVALTGLSFPFGVAVDASGTLYVTDTGNDRVVALPPGAAEPVVLPFTGLWEPCGVAVDAAGTVYVADSLNDRVLTLAVGATDATEVPVPGLKYPGGIAVDDAGNLYLADRANYRVLKLAAGASIPTVLLFNGIRDPKDLAVDGTGAVYVTDGTMHNPDNPYSGRVVKLDGDTAGSADLKTGLRSPFGVTLDTAGDVYVCADVKDGEVLKLPSTAPGTPVAVVTGLHQPAGVAIDTAGTIYVAETPPGDDDQSRGRIVKLTGP
jgi:sugar lactone lactonase YvrE